ncbi:helix-turn-helix transcriptional regulator [Streptomyces sp. NBC_01764]|uniref:winged helix-turn-helix transcriptional regulator n=1 Tax=Streptomyces sp. NBC_01764 TaxID=2975935 RepID=UPI00224E94E0|nr:helix-turn-helix domain-containing protein [Streptomyces sp. NBC_01764]MCX4409461.1 helix-turn-helix transcriptional regulator [Streptomyces sp. NBC_01764]
MLILRDASSGVCRFDDFRRHIGLSEAALSNRLRKLTAADILRTAPYKGPGSRTRHEYLLPPKGWGLWPVLAALRQWGEGYPPDPDDEIHDIQDDRCGPSVRAAVQ